MQDNLTQTTEQAVSVPEEQTRRESVVTEQPVTVPMESQGLPQRPKPKAKPPIKIFAIIGGILLVSFVLFLLIASHKSGPTTGGKVTLTYWGLWEDAPVMESVIADFERQNPNITVTYSKQDPKEYIQRLLTRAQNGTGPDVFRFHNTWLTPLGSLLLPLPNSVMTPSQFSKTFYPVATQDLVKNGALYGIPLEIDTLSLFTNNTLLQKANVSIPTTWETFTTIAKGLTVKDANGKIKISGAAIGTFDNITHAPDIFSLLLVQNGVDPKQLTPASNASDALTFYTSFAKGDGSIWDTTLEPSISGFAHGTVAMYFGYSYDVFSIKALSPSLSFTIAPVPHLPGRDMTLASYWAEGVSAKSTHQKEAFLFMQFLAQKETAQKLFTEESKTRSFGEPYAQVDLADTVKTNALLYPFLFQAKSAASSPFVGDTKDTVFNGPLNSYLGNAIRSVLGTTSVQSAIDTLTKGTAQIFSQYAQK